MSVTAHPHRARRPRPKRPRPQDAPLVLAAAVVTGTLVAGYVTPERKPTV